MHIQARARTAKSPADLLEFLRVLDRDDGDGRINIEGVTGPAVEDGGFFCFAVAHRRARQAHDRLTDAGYHVEWTKALYRERIPPHAGSGSTPAPAVDDPNQPGVLAGIIERAKDSQIAGGRPIHEVMIGAVTGQPGVFFAQVTFVGTPWSDLPDDDD
jgi:hypothetical protein